MSDFTSIAAGRRDADSPVNESLVDDAIENTEYNQERALRCGTHTTGVRQAYARGLDTFSTSTNGSNIILSGTVTFSTDSADGNPNFLSAPYVWFALEENTDGGGSLQWTSGNVYNFRGPYLIDTTRANTGFSWELVVDKNSGATFEGNVYWFAIGEVTAGE